MTTNNLPFIEKYKPKKIEDLVLNEIILKQLNGFVVSKSISNLVLSGSSGIGKSSFINCLVKKIYPKEYINDLVFELNSFDDRGIEINTFIINFAKKKIDFEDNNSLCKLIIIEEADNITDKTQKLISSNFEKYPNLKFIFTCNNTNEIIECIQSRCSIICFTEIPEKQLINRLQYICKSENIENDEQSLLYLFNSSNKDIRKTINNMELVYYTEKKITIDNINSVLNIPSLKIYEDLYESIINKNIEKICLITRNLKNEGYYAFDVLIYFINFLIKYEMEEEEDLKIKLINILSKQTFVMSSKSVCNYIQLTGSLLSCIE